MVGFCGGTAMCACCWQWDGLRAEELVLCFQPLFSFQAMPYCVRLSEEIGGRCGGVIIISLQNNVEV